MGKCCLVLGIAALLIIAGIVIFTPIAKTTLADIQWNYTVVPSGNGLLLRNPRMYSGEMFLFTEGNEVVLLTDKLDNQSGAFVEVTRLRLQPDSVTSSVLAEGLVVHLQSTGELFVEGSWKLWSFEAYYRFASNAVELSFLQCNFDIWRLQYACSPRY